MRPGTYRDKNGDTVTVRTTRSGYSIRNVTTGEISFVGRSAK